MLRRCAPILAIVLIIPNLRDADAAPPDAAAVERLVEQLDAGTLVERRSAELKLLKLGPDVLPLLPAPELLPNASVREAVRRIRIRLERDQAVVSLKASKIDVPRSSTLRELLGAIEAQTGNRLDASSLSKETLGRRVSVDEGAREFWPLMEELAREFQFRFEPAAESSALRLISSKDGGKKESAAAVSHSGAFRVVFDSAELRPRIGREGEHLLRLRLSILAEPRLRPLFLKFGAKDVRVTAGDGVELKPFNPQAQWELPLGEGGKRVELQLDFEVPKTTIPAQVDIAGTAMMLTAAGRETFEFSNPIEQEGVARRRGGVSVKLDQVRFEKESGGAEVGLIVAYDTGGPAFESHRTWIFHNQAYLVSRDGRRIEREGNFGTRLQRDGGVAVEYTFKDLTHTPESYGFVYVAPTLLVNAPVELSFSRVPVERNLER